MPNPEKNWGPKKGAVLDSRTKKITKEESN